MFPAVTSDLRLCTSHLRTCPPTCVCLVHSLKRWWLVGVTSRSALLVTHFCFTSAADWDCVGRRRMKIKKCMFSQTVCRVCAFERDRTWEGCPLYLCASHFPCSCGGSAGWLGVECVGPPYRTLPSGSSPAPFNWLQQIYQRPLQNSVSKVFFLLWI